MKNQSIIFLSLLLSTFFSNLVLAGSSIASGQFSSAFSSWGTASLAGNWSIVKHGEDYYIQLDENFAAKKGPDVKVFLSPIESASVTGENATEGSLFIKLIDKFEGPLRLKIPAGTDISKFRSLVFHCEEYSKLWGTSPLP